jgi:hypothetical protein
MYQLVLNITFCHIKFSSVVNVVSSSQVTKSIVFNRFICIVILSHVNLKVENQHYAKKKFMGLSLKPSPNCKPTKKKKKAKEWKINKVFQNV